LASACGKSRGGGFDIQFREFPAAAPPNHSASWKADPAVKALYVGSLPHSYWGSLRQGAQSVHPRSLSAQLGQPELQHRAGVCRGKTHYCFIGVWDAGVVGAHDQILSNG